ncbi:MAG: hypothetical protein ACRDJE_13910, partial [Dehalococcoidia bacterium]
LPERARFLSAPLAAAAEDLTRRAIDDALQRERVQEAWLTALRFAHDRLVAFLRDETRVVQTADGDITLNLFPLIDVGLRQVEGLGLLPEGRTLPDLSTATPAQARQQLSQALGVQLPQDFGEVRLAEADQLESAQTAVEWFDRLAIILPIVAVLLIGGALWLSLDRRRTAIQLGVGIAVALLLAGLVVELLGKEVVSGMADNLDAQTITAATIATLTDSLWQALALPIVLGAIVAAVAFLAGKRAWLETAGQRVQGWSRGAATGRVTAGRWAAEHLDALRLGGVALALLALFLLNLTWAVFLTVLALLVLFEVGVTVAAGRGWAGIGGGSGRSAVGGGAP